MHSLQPSTDPRAWQRMLSGRRLDLLDPSPLDIEIEDIAHGLARVARWNGQTDGEHAFSVARSKTGAHISRRLKHSQNTTFNAETAETAEDPTNPCDLCVLCIKAPPPRGGLTPGPAR